MSRKNKRPSTRPAPREFSVTPARAFELLTSRVQYLNEKIELTFRRGLPNGLYVQERDAVLWAMDTIKDLSERLLEAQDTDIIALQSAILNKLMDRVAT